MSTLQLPNYSLLSQFIFDDGTSKNEISRISSKLKHYLLLLKYKIANKITLYFFKKSLLYCLNQIKNNSETLIIKIDSREVEINKLKKVRKNLMDAMEINVRYIELLSNSPSKKLIEIRNILIEFNSYIKKIIDTSNTALGIIPLSSLSESEINLLANIIADSYDDDFNSDDELLAEKFYFESGKRAKIVADC